MVADKKSKYIQNKADFNDNFVRNIKKQAG
jgi:hypothetical protein